MADIIQRSFELVQSGQCRSVEELKKGLKQEGFSQNLIDAHLAGAGIRRELNKILADKRRAKSDG